MTEFNEIGERHQNYHKLIEKANEGCLLALVSALSMEEALDLFLGIYIPGYSRIKENNDFTLFMKLEMARVLRWIPEQILGAVVLISSMRNKFAHDLALNSCAALDSGTQGHLKQRYGEVVFGDKKGGMKLNICL